MKVLILITLFMIIGCGKSSDDGDYVNVIEGQGIEEYKDFVKNHKVECEADCPKSVGLVSFNIDGQTAMCSGTIVKNNYVLTNAHCLPKNLQVGDSCPNIHFHRPQGSYSKKVFECQRIERKIRTYRTLEESQDLAIFKIKGHSYNSSSIARKLLSNSDTLKFYPVYTSRFGHTVIKSKSCLNSYGPNMYGHFTSLSRGILLPNCKVIPGNSGSALFHNKKIVGVIYAHVNDNLNPEDFALGSQILCEKLGPLGNRVPSECLNRDSKIEKLQNDQFSQYAKVLNDKIVKETEVNKIFKKAKSIFTADFLKVSYKLRPSSFNISMERLVECAHNKPGLFNDNEFISYKILFRFNQTTGQLVFSLEETNNKIEYEYKSHDNYIFSELDDAGKEETFKVPKC